MPWARSVTVWTRPQPGQPEERLDVAKQLAATTADRVEWAQAAFGLGKRRVEGLRLTAFRLPPQSAARYRAALRESQRRQGRLPTPEALELAGWLILITNAPVAKLPTAMIAFLYRLRWQIELIFRQVQGHPAAGPGSRRRSLSYAMRDLGALAPGGLRLLVACPRHGRLLAKTPPRDQL